MRTPLQKGETIILVTHSSWVSLVGPALLGIIGLVAAYFVGISQWGWVLALAGILYFLFRYFSWNANIWVVTNYRVIDELGLLNHFAKESPLDKINNVSYDQGIWGRLLNYGHVKIQTAAQVGATDYYNVDHPKRLKDTITQAQSDLEQIKVSNQARQMADALGIQGTAGIGSELQKLADLKQRGMISGEEFDQAKNKLLKG
ncbi:MAG TPA: PH domain-containing protein [Puia sp.]|nr:PH domain-containing protein [Puia sp.]